MRLVAIAVVCNYCDYTRRDGQAELGTSLHTEIVNSPAACHPTGPDVR